jgi:hypothetical protein
MVNHYHVTGVVWKYDGYAAWYFLGIDKDTTRDIKAKVSQKKAFGSVKCIVTVGATTWRTSLFPDKQSETYLLPIKKIVRTREGVENGDRVECTIEILI